MEWTDFGPFVQRDWRIIELAMPKADGGLLRIWLARPLWWLEEEGVALSETIELDLPKMGAEGAAEVVDVSPCPTPNDGPGRLVTGRFVHENAEILDVHGAGLEKPIGTTAAHTFWSEDQQAFVPAGELKIGEQLRTYAGELASVTAIAPRAERETVYNLEVDGEHAYHVGAQGILAHNNYVKKIDGYLVGPYGKVKSHHILQHAAVKNVKGYSHSKAFSVFLGKKHILTYKAQRRRRAATYAAERLIAFRALRDAGVPKSTAKKIIREADKYFFSLGVKMNSVMRALKNATK